MKISHNIVLTVHYKLSNAQGNLIEESSEPMVYFQSGYESTLPKIEEALDGKERGYNTELQIEPDDAFGEYDSKLVKIELRNRLRTPLQIGMQFAGTPDGEDDDEQTLISLSPISLMRKLCWTVIIHWQA